jgi:hypothetical protein
MEINFDIDTSTSSDNEDEERIVNEYIKTGISKKLYSLSLKPKTI